MLANSTQTKEPLMHTRVSLLVGIVLMTLSSFMLAACGGGAESGYVGHWELDKEAFKATLKAEMEKEQGENGADEGMAAFAAAMMMGAIDAMQMDVEIKKDHTFVATTKMEDAEPDTANGTWKLEGDAIVMTSPGEETGRMALKDGKLHLTIETQPDQPAMIFKKK